MQKRKIARTSSLAYTDLVAKQISFSVSADSMASPAAIWALLADGTTWPTWSPIGSFHLEKEGADGGESLGAIRVFKTGTTKSREELLELTPGTRLRYSALSGMPFRNHEASVELTPNDTGTTITWHEQWDAHRPGSGWLLKRFLSGFVQKCADGLASHAATQ